MNIRFTQPLPGKSYTKQLQNVFLLLSFVITTQLFAQKADKYIEVWQRVNYIGATRIEGAYYPEDKAGNPDSSINITRIEGIIKDARKDKKPSVWVLNELAKEGWTLVSTVFVPGSEFNSGFVSYYLRKTFDQFKP